MRQYDQIELDTVEEANLFLPGMQILIGDDDAEWTVYDIILQSDATVLVYLYKD